MEVRRYKPGEEKEIWRLYFDTTHQIVAREYTAEQIDRWAPADVDIEAWSRKLARTQPFVALVENAIVGFAELEPDGHIDYFYCHYAWQRKGVGTELLKAIEKEARTLGLASLFTEVSTTGIAFFRAIGFEVEQERVNLVCGAPAKQFVVRKQLHSSSSEDISQTKSP